METILHIGIEVDCQRCTWSSKCVAAQCVYLHSQTPQLNTSPCWHLLTIFARQCNQASLREIFCPSHLQRRVCAVDHVAAPMVWQCANEELERRWRTCVALGKSFWKKRWQHKVRVLSQACPSKVKHPHEHSSNAWSQASREKSTRTYQNTFSIL